MNKITPHLIRDLDSTLPAGTECYLCSTVRRALAKHRNGKEPMAYIPKDQAISILASRLGRGLQRFLTKDVRAMLTHTQLFNPEKLA